MCLGFLYNVSSLTLSKRGYGYFATKLGSHQENTRNVSFFLITRKVGVFSLY